MTRLQKPEAPEIRGTCVECGINPQSHKGYGKFRASCLSCHNKRYPNTAAYYRDYMRARREHEGFIEDERRKRQKIGYKAFKKDHCEKCGFVAEHSCQLDVDHRDGDKSNADPSNFQTLCANCHRLKTRLKQDFKKRKPGSTMAPLRDDFTLTGEYDTIRLSGR